MPAAPITTDVTRAAAALRAGALVGMPTETVYGLAAMAEDEAAVQHVFTVKGRPAASPLIVHLDDAAALTGWGRPRDDCAQRLAAHFWPGPLTIILEASGRAAPSVAAGRSTLALRVPDHPQARRLIQAAGGAVVAPSANRYGAVSPTSAADVAAAFDASEVAVVLDGGRCRVGLESTIIDLTRDEARLLRPGAVSRSQLERVMRRPVLDAISHVDAGQLASLPTAAPGQATSHYAPRALVWLAADLTDAARSVSGAVAAGRRVGIIAAYSPEALAAAGLPAAVMVLAAEPDSGLLAHGLYAALRDADAAGLDVVVAVTPRRGPLAEAVRDRLGRAAAPRP